MGGIENQTNLLVCDTLDPQTFPDGSIRHGMIKRENIKTVEKIRIGGRRNKKQYVCVV